MKHPNLVWEARRPDGSVMSCLLESGAATHAVVLFVDGEFFEVKEFADLRTARQRTRSLYVEAIKSAAAASDRKADTRRRKADSLNTEDALQAIA